MGILKRKLTNTAAVNMPLPRPMPGPMTIHNHSTGWAGIIAVSFVCLLVSLPLMWFALVFLFSKMGSRNPDRETALFIVSIAALYFIGRGIGWALLAFLDWLKDYKLEILRELTEQKRVELAAVSASVDPGRMNEDDYNFARVILAVMMAAYKFLSDNGYDSFPARWRPWSMRSAMETAGEMGIKLSQDRANSVSVWLHKKGVITSPDAGGQITKKFPDLASVRAMLDKEFGRPIQAVSPALLNNRGFKFTE